MFRTCFRDSFQGELAAQYAKDDGYTKVGIVYCSADTYSAGLRDAFTAACGSKGLEIVAEESVASMAEVDYILEQVPQVVRELRQMSPVWSRMLETMPDPYR